MDFKQLQEDTDKAVSEPQVGDRFTEMYSFYLYVIGLDDGLVATLEASPPCTFPEDGTLKVQTKEEFKKRLSYGSTEGYWVTLAGRGHNVSGWLLSAVKARLQDGLSCQKSLP